MLIVERWLFGWPPHQVFYSLAEVPADPGGAWFAWITTWAFNLSSLRSIIAPLDFSGNALDARCKNRELRTIFSEQADQALSWCKGQVHVFEGKLTGFDKLGARHDAPDLKIDPTTASLDMPASAFDLGDLLVLLPVLDPFILSEPSPKISPAPCIS